MTVKEIMALLEKRAPNEFKEEWDNVGLMAGNEASVVTKALVSLDVTNEVTDRAIKVNAELIISHHPIIFKPLKSVTSGFPAGRCIIKMLSNNIACYAMHTNFDSCAGGLNDHLADIVGIVNGRPIEPVIGHSSYKLVTFVPPDRVVSVQKTLCDAGAGIIGEYDYCTFRTEGVGSFRGSEKSSPVIGEAGKYEETQELRLEVVVPRKALHQCIDALVKTHPYEEPAYDLYPLETLYRDAGIGRFGKLQASSTVAEIARTLQKTLGCPAMRTVGDADKRIETVGVCSGGGGSLVESAIRHGCDLFITGEVKYHEALAAQQSNMAILAAGHYYTERPFVDIVSAILAECAPELAVEKCYLPGSPFAE